MPPLILIALISGYLAGVLVNLLADYLPARRHYDLARRSPFSTLKPARPTFIPRGEDGHPRPVYLWSGLIAVLLRAPTVHPFRRVIAEIGLTAAFALIAGRFATARFLPFYLFYAAVFALVIITDIEYRWILPEVTWLAALVALAESLIARRLSLGETLQGGLLGFGALFALYLFGYVFAYLTRLLTGRRVNRTILGFGDVRLALFSGLILGSSAIGPALLLMMIGGGIAALVFVLNKQVRKGRYRRYSAIPYGPYIVLGTALMLYAPSFAFDLLRLIMRLLR
jgi:prepilin signal peptidase PulO-like enzyme (type II secretory pathway)